MLKFIEIYCFRGWKREEKREFFISLALTIAACVIIYVFASVLQMMPVK